MAQAMTVHRLGQRGVLRRVLHGLLQAIFMHVMAPDDTATRIDRQARAGKDILPSLYGRRLRILACQGVRQKHGHISLCEISLVSALDRGEMLLQRLGQALRQRHDAILLPLPVPHHDLVVCKIGILHAQPDAIHQAHTRAVQQRRHKSVRAMHVCQELADFGTA